MNRISLHIAALTEGFLLEEAEDKKYALSTGMEMIEKVREIFGLNSEDAPESVPAELATQERTKHLLTERDDPADPAGRIFCPVPAEEKFVFQECEPESFPWQNLLQKPEKRFGKTIIHQAGNVLRITREGYSVVVFVDLESLKRLKVLLYKDNQYFNSAVSMISYNKRTVLRTCLNEVDLSKLDDVDCDDCNKKAEADEPEMPERTKRLWEIAREKQDKWRTENTARAEE